MCNEFGTFFSFKTYYDAIVNKYEDMKIFRKIRRNLIALGKFKSYIRYALGEIVLIVIGISIAWKINSLSDNLKNKVVE
jgi:hypothetical protein